MNTEKMKRKRDVRLNNVMFPVWFFFMYPTWLWLIILPINFAIDSLVLTVAAKVQNIEYKVKLWEKSILKIWIIGFVSDFLGALLLFVLMLVFDVMHISLNIYLFPGTTIFSTIGVALAGVLIYFLNKRFSFKDCGLSKQQIHKICLALAIFTAPYAMMIPIYG